VIQAVLLVLQARPVIPAQQDLQVHLVLQVLQDQQVLQEPQAVLVVPQEHQVLQVLQVLKVLLE